MDHSGNQELPLTSRAGFHYYPDTLHYNDTEIARWIPILKRMQATWLVLLSSTQRAIPEYFIHTLSSEGINPIIDFALSPKDDYAIADLRPLIQAYGRWGGKYVLVDHMPNQKSSWTSRDWGNPHLIKNFCLKYIEFAEISLDHGIRPVFSPLYPGGDYWDMAFLKTCASFLADHASNRVINNLTFSAYGWDFGKPLDWGAGGPSVWPRANAYHRNIDTEDQCGFRAYEWHLAAVESVFQRKFPFHLLQIGLPCALENPSFHDFQPNIPKQEAIMQLLKRENVYSKQEPERLLCHIPDEVLSGNFYLLTSSDQQDEYFKWFSTEGDALPPAQAYAIRHQLFHQSTQEGIIGSKISKGKNLNFQFKRYILISEKLRGNVAHLLEKMQPYIERYKPRVGFDREEAARSAVIVYLTPQEDLDERILQDLLINGSLLKQIHPDEILNLMEEQSDAQ